MNFDKFLEKEALFLTEIKDKIKSSYPDEKVRFRALDYFKEIKVKVVILGQDPYHDGSADGLAFSCPRKIPASLKNIFKALKEQGYENKSADLSHWAEQGVLLLNTALSVEKSKPKSHVSLWTPFTIDLIKHICENAYYCVWLLWGRPAQTYKQYITVGKVYECCHPSPLNGTRFIEEQRECPHFLKANKRLVKHDMSPIDWDS